MKYHWEQEVVDNFREQEKNVDTFEKLEAFETKIKDYIEEVIESSFTDGDDDQEMFDSLSEAIYIQH